MSAAVSGGERELWCKQCRAHRLAVLRRLGDALVYRCNACRNWNRCKTCAGTITPDHAERCGGAS